MGVCGWCWNSANTTTPETPCVYCGRIYPWEMRTVRHAVTSVGDNVTLTARTINGFQTLTPSSPAQLPATPDAQDVVDALVALGLVTQAES